MFSRTIKEPVYSPLVEKSFDKLNTKFHGKILELLTPMVKPKSKEGFHEGKDRLIKELENVNKPKIVDWMKILCQI